MKHVRLVWKYGEEAICPECGHNNACLQTGTLGDVTTYECRDCHNIFITTREIPCEEKGRDPLMDRKVIEQEALQVKRRLGKSCPKCSSFNLDHRHGTGDDGAQRYGWWCGDCGEFWGT